MIDQVQRETHTATTTFAFFGAGHFFSFLADQVAMHNVNTLLSTLSFLVSITAGIFTIVKHLQKRKQQ
jgi:hypothetical protein